MHGRMSLAHVDLNLFSVFDAIYREGGITAASKRLHLSQPAVSHALARLRELLGDPLFERQGKAMVPTPRARQLAGSIRHALSELEQSVHGAQPFDPRQAQRSFVVAQRDAHELSFLPQLAASLQALAPQVELRSVRHVRRTLERDLRSGVIDVALDVPLALPPEIRRQSLRSEPMVVLARRDHPRVRGELSLETYLALEHVLVSGRRHGGGYEDAALSRS